MSRITGVITLENYRVELTFDDGVQGIVDLSHLAGHGVFALWNDYTEFEKVRIGEDGDLIWVDKIDLCPDSLYMKVTGRKPEEVFPGLKHESAHA